MSSSTSVPFAWRRKPRRREAWRSEGEEGRRRGEAGARRAGGGGGNPARGFGTSRAVVAAAYLRVEEEGAPFGVHPPAVVAGDVELECGLGEGATIA